MEAEKRAAQLIEKILTRIIAAGYQVDTKTLSFLKKLASDGTLEEVIERTISKVASLPERPFFLTKELIETTSKEQQPPPKTVVESVTSEFRPHSREVESDIQIMNDLKEERMSGEVEEFVSYFRDRFVRISDMLRKRSDARDAVPIRKALEAPLGSKLKVIAFVTEKRERTNSIAIEIEDLDDRATVVVSSSSNRTGYEKARRLFLDQVVCVEVTKYRDKLLIANDFINPDIPERRPKSGKEELYVALISDIHIGSRKFLGETFDRFLKWLSGKSGSAQEREIAGRVKYVIIAGDLVDGIGVYPNQERELEIRDVYKQYSVAGEILSAIPDYIEVILIPGNHDATSQALPQAAVPEEFLKLIRRHRDVISLRDPAKIRLHGVETLIYHGRSLDDVVGVIPEVTYQNLRDSVPLAMRALIKARHLAPNYGARTPIVATRRDELVIDVPPDILHCGHVHVMGSEMYRGTLLVNSGTWQGQTSYQERMGLEPTPGIAPVVNLKDLSVVRVNFAA